MIPRAACAPTLNAALMLALLGPAAWAQPSDGPARLTDVAVESVDDTVAVSIATMGAPKYRLELMDGPFRLVFDFDNTLYGWKKTPVPVGAGPVKEIRGSQFRVGVARLVIELTRRAKYRIERQADGVIRVVFVPATKAAPPTAGAPPSMPSTRTAPSEIAPPTPAPIPTKPSATVPATTPAKPKGQLTWRLQGIVVSDDASIAYIADPVTNQVTRYVVGDRIGDGRVGAIEERRVVLRMPRGDVELRFEEPPLGAPK